jgi:hypothetical protein
MTETRHRNLRKALSPLATRDPNEKRLIVGRLRVTSLVDRP